jgi:hypothetical protein
MSRRAFDGPSRARQSKIRPLSTFSTLCLPIEAYANFLPTATNVCKDFEDA